AASPQLRGRADNAFQGFLGLRGGDRNLEGNAADGAFARKAIQPGATTYDHDASCLRVTRDLLERLRSVITASHTRRRQKALNAGEFRHCSAPAAGPGTGLAAAGLHATRQ